MTDLNIRNRKLGLIIKIIIYTTLAYGFLAVCTYKYVNKDRYIFSWDKVKLVAKSLNNPGTIDDELPTSTSSKSKKSPVINVSSSLNESGNKLLQKMQAGGLVFYFRHFKTSHVDVKDDIYKSRHIDIPIDIFSDCSWQRPLSDQGVAEAEEVGKIIRLLNIPIGEVYTSPYCRLMESAISLFPKKKLVVDQKLIYRKGNYSSTEANQQVLKYLQTKPATGTNNVIVGHRPPMDGIGSDKIGEGDVYIFEYLDTNKLNLVATMTPKNWLFSFHNPEFLGRQNGKIFARTKLSKWYAEPKLYYPDVETLIKDIKLDETD